MDVHGLSYLRVPNYALAAMALLTLSCSAFADDDEVLTSANNTRNNSTLSASSRSDGHGTETDLSPVEMQRPPIMLLGQAEPEAMPANEANPTEAAEQKAQVGGVPSITPVGTSRPSFTDAVTTIPQGSLQVESGATYMDNRGGSYSWTTPETLMRLGVLKNTELRFTTPTYTYLGNNRPGSLANNFGDISVGLSQHMMLPGKVDFAIVPILNIPTGAKLVGSHGLDPQLRLVVGKYVTPKLFLSSMIDARWYTDRDASAPVIMMPTLIGYYSLTKKLTGFLEYASLLPVGEKSNIKSSQYLQTGALYLLTPRQQIDARVAVGLNKNSPNILVGFGYSFRVDGLFGTSRSFSSFKPKTASAQP